MKKILGKLLIGILIATGTCTGIFQSTTTAHAASSHHTMTDSSMETESMACCNAHESQTKVTFQETRKIEACASQIAPAVLSDQPKLLSNSQKLRPTSKAPPGKTTLRLVKAVIRLE